MATSSRAMAFHLYQSGRHSGPAQILWAALCQHIITAVGIASGRRPDIAMPSFVL